MTRIRPFKYDSDWDYVHGLTAAILTADTCGIVAEDEKGVCGMVIFDSITPNSAQAHIALTAPIRAIRGGLFHAACDFLFRVLDKGVMYGLVPACNEKALKLDKHVGLKEIYRLNDAYDEGIDYVVLEMRRENCRWLGEPAHKAPVQLDLFRDAG